MKKLLFSAFLLLLALTARAQFTAVDWGTAQGDTLLPECTLVQSLPADYALYDYSAVVEYPEFQPMTAEEVARYRLRGREGEFGPQPVVNTYVSVSAKVPSLNVTFLPVVQEGGEFSRINSYKLVVKRAEKPLLAQRAAQMPQARYAENSVLSAGKWVKISVSQRGVHQITASQLSKMGFKDIEKVRIYGYGGNVLPEQNIHTLPDDLCEVPFLREGSRLLFYAAGTVSWSYNRTSGGYVHKQNVYSRASHYFLTESEGEPASFHLSPKASDAAVTLTAYPDYELYEKEEHTLCNLGRVLFEGYDYASGRSRSYSFSLPGISDAAINAEISFGTSGEAGSTLAVEVNGVASSVVVPAAAKATAGSIKSATVKGSPRENTSVKITQKVSNNSQTGFLDYIRLNFTRKLAFRSPQMNFRGNSTLSGNAEYVISSAPSTLCVLRVTAPGEMSLLQGDFSGSNCSVVAPRSCEEEYVAFDPKATFPSVEIVGDVPCQNLHALQQADLVIIIPSSGKLREPAERLAAAHRTMDNLSVALVTADEVYNEFSSGTPDATAYRRFMKMLYDRASSAATAPKYLLLFGDGCFDNRMFTYRNRSADDYLLCYESENSVSPIYSYVMEDYFGLLDDAEGANLTRDKVDVGVGRIPVVTLSDANAVVDKIIAYMKNEQSGAWQNVITLLGDDGDDDIPNQHMKDVEAIADILKENYPAYITERIYWDNFEPEATSTGNSYPAVTQAIRERLDEGALVVNYAGHGSPTTISHEKVWMATDMQALSSPRLPFWVTASCDIGPFDVGDNSLAESALLNRKGGAVGLFTTTRTVLQIYNAIINKAFMRVLLTPTRDGRKQAVGDAVRLAKNNVITSSSDLSENKLQFVLLGDPALRLKLPEYGFVVERLNGVDAAEQSNAPAGGVLSVEGYVTRPDGSLADDFTGLLATTLYDSEEEVFTKDNLGYGPISYTAYEKKLFAGSDSVRNGRFNIKILVPMDVSYSGEKGLLNFFATDTTKVFIAQGAYDNFVIAGTAPGADSDKQGPEIKIYLNTPSFIDGDEVNATPCLFAELYDESGVSTIGSGIGHDIMLMVDNNPARTYNLNKVYEPYVGDYTRGTITFPIETLSPGEHKLQLRAWDIYNNSAVEELTFVVVEGLAPQFSLQLNPSPARSGQVSRFELAHGLPATDIDVSIEVLNLQGQLLWAHGETANGGSVYTCDWNVTGQGGAPLPTGVYLLRARLSAGGSEWVTKTGKFLVINNK